MALTLAQQNAVVFNLGWPAKTLIVGSTHYDQTIATRMLSLDADSEQTVIALLDQISDMRAKFTASTSRMLVKQVGDITLNDGEHAALSTEYRRLLRDLSVMLDIPLLGKGGRNVTVTL